VVLLNERGEVSECTSANIFVAQGGSVYTPPLSSGCLPGVTRAVLIEEIRPSSGLRVTEKTLFPADLESADEVFITSTTRELLPVVEIQGLKVKGGRVLCDSLVGELKQYVQGYLSGRRAHARCS
jgi:branched-chain amino acid aminotransferase